MSHSYNPQNADIHVKIDGIWRPADEQQKAAYIAYKSRHHNYKETPYTHGNDITIFREGNNNPEKTDDPYMPTYFKLEGSRRSTVTKYPIIDMNDIYTFLTEGVSGNGGRNGGGGGGGGVGMNPGLGGNGGAGGDGYAVVYTW